MAMLVTCAGLLGLVIGSFLNVVIWRVPRGESIVRPGSHCASCDHPLSARDNVPLLSWLALAGRCRYCGAAVSPRYPLVELVTAGLFAAMAARFGAHLVLLAFLYLAAISVALAAIDLDVQRLPNVLTLPSYVVGGALLGLSALTAHDGGAMLRAAIGMAALYGGYLLLTVVKPGGMGWGDVKLAGVLGLYLGFLGWRHLVVGAFLAFLLGGVASVALVVIRRAGRKSRIPFGPFMLAGAVIAVFAGDPVMHWYLHTTIG